MGFGLKPFLILKFATMLEQSPNIGNGDITVRDDPRVLPVGRFLRKTKINELPQLWNVLIGEMSLVGPRPLTLNQFGLYSADTAAVIAKAKPGITGVSALVFRDEERFLAGRANRGNIILGFCCRERRGSNPGIRKTGLSDRRYRPFIDRLRGAETFSRIAETWVHNASGVGSPTFTMEPRRLTPAKIGDNNDDPGKYPPDREGARQKPWRISQSAC